MPVDPKRVQAVFLAAVEYQNPADRAAVLDRECATNVELRQRVESLLQAHDQPGSFLDQPVVGPVDQPRARSALRNGGAASRESADLSADRTPPLPAGPAP